MSFLSQIKRSGRRMLFPKNFRQPAYPHGYESTTLPEKYSLTGFYHGEIADRPAFQTLYRTLQDLNTLSTPGSYRWEKKSPGYFLLRPKLNEFAPVFIDFLIENAIPELILQLTGQTLCLADVTYIHHVPGIENDWHRDTYIYNNKSTGPFPPVFKLIYYPCFDAAPKPQLKIIPGSHHRVYFDRATDESQIRRRDTETILSENRRFVFFDSTVLHAVCPETDPHGSYRLHFQFARKSQLDERYSEGVAFQSLYSERARL